MTVGCYSSLLLYLHVKLHFPPLCFFFFSVRLWVLCVFCRHICIMFMRVSVWTVSTGVWSCANDLPVAQTSVKCCCAERKKERKNERKREAHGGGTERKPWNRRRPDSVNIIIIIIVMTCCYLPPFLLLLLIRAPASPSGSAPIRIRTVPLLEQEKPHWQSLKHQAGWWQKDGGNRQMDIESWHVMCVILALPSAHTCT